MVDNVHKNKKYIWDVQNLLKIADQQAHDACNRLVQVQTTFMLRCNTFVCNKVAQNVPTWVPTSKPTFDLQNVTSTN